MEHLLKISEVAQILNVSQSTLRNWDKQKIFQPIKTFGKHRRYTQTQINNFLQGHYTSYLQENQNE